MSIQREIRIAALENIRDAAELGLKKNGSLSVSALVDIAHNAKRALKESVFVFAHHVGNRSDGPWQVRGSDGYHHTVLRSGLPNRQVAEAWIKHACDGWVREDGGA